MNLKTLEIFWSWLISPGNFVLFIICFACYFLPKLWQRIIVLAIASFYLKFYPGTDPVILIFISVGIFANWLCSYSKTKTPFALLLAIILPFVVFYSLLKLLT